MQLFYDPDLTVGPYELRSDEARHAARVLRKAVGDTLDLTDGRGGWYRGTVTEIDKRSCRLDVVRTGRSDRRAPRRLTLLVAPTKSMDRFEFMLEKVTEIGIDVIQPFFSEHSERTRLRTDRLSRIIEAAAKQSIRPWLPELREPTDFAGALENCSGTSNYLAYLGGEETPLLRDLPPVTDDVVVAVGPEGGFSRAEADLARGHAYRWASLGPHRLRTETAAIAAVHTLESLGW